MSTTEIADLLLQLQVLGDLRRIKVFAAPRLTGDRLPERAKDPAAVTGLLRPETNDPFVS